MTALIIIASIIGYMFAGGMVGYSFYMTRERRCKDCRGEGRYYSGCMNDHGTSSVFFGAFWPFTIPMLFGALTANYFNNREGRAQRKEKRRDAEHDRKMAEIEAQRKLADEQRVAMMESVKFLVENGIKADVPGLFENVEVI